MSSSLADPDDLCREVARRYAEYASYRDEGVVSTRFVYSPESSLPEITNRTHFRTLFVRPSTFRFDFRVEPSFGKLPDPKWQRYVAWSLGGITREWWTLRPQVRERPNLFDAIGSAAGISGGSSSRISSLLLPELAPRSVLPARGTGTLVAVEPIERYVCHRLEFQTHATRRTTLWIDTESFLVRRVLEATRFTREFQADLHRQAEEARAKLPPEERLSPEKQRLFDARPPEVQNEFVGVSTTVYRPVANAPIEQAELESDLPWG